jgi:hypothetical protein
MEDFESKYNGPQVEEMLDQIANGMTGGGVTEEYVNNAIANAITTTLNTEV